MAQECNVQLYTRKDLLKVETSGGGNTEFFATETAFFIMSSSLHKDLLSAARNNLKQTKRLSMMAALNLAAEILAVDCGLKPCFLYDYTTSGVEQICSYLKELQNLGLIVSHLHILNLEENILIINVAKAVSYLETLLHSQDLHLVDVSNNLSQPMLVSSDKVPQIHAQLAELITYIKPYERGQPSSLSVGGVQSPKWNLCTMFGFLLQFPSAYWFDTAQDFENCLSFTPLRLFTVQANCCRISHQRVQIYSFTVPECVYPAMQMHLEEWSQRLRQTFEDQNNFTDLKIITETVTLPAVAL